MIILSSLSAIPEILNCEPRAVFPLRGSHPRPKTADFEDKKKGPLCGPLGSAFGSHPRGRGFESLQVHQIDPKRTQIVDGHISMAVLCYTGQPFCHPRDTLRKHIDILTSSKGFKAILPRSFSLVNSFRPFLLKKFCRSWLPDSGRKIARHSTCNLQSLCARRGFFLFLHHNPTPYRTGHC